MAVDSSVIMIIARKPVSKQGFLSNNQKHKELARVSRMPGLAAAC